MHKFPCLHCPFADKWLSWGQVQEMIAKLKDDAAAEVGPRSGQGYQQAGLRAECKGLQHVDTAWRPTYVLPMHFSAVRCGSLSHVPSRSQPTSSCPSAHSVAAVQAVLTLADDAAWLAGRASSNAHVDKV